MLRLRQPGVYLQELPSGAHSIVGSPTSVVLFVGPMASGIDGRATRLFNFGDFSRAFGGLATTSSLSWSVLHFFANGGGEAWVTRVKADGAANWKSLNMGFQSTFAAALFPDIEVDDPLVPGAIRSHPPSGAMAGVIARTDGAVGVWQEPAGADAMASEWKYLPVRRTASYILRSLGDGLKWGSASPMAISSGCSSG